MEIRGISVGMYVAVQPLQEAKPKPKSTPPSTPPQKYHDTTPVRSPDYSFGTSPPKPGYWTRPSSPNKSPKL